VEAKLAESRAATEEARAGLRAAENTVRLAVQQAYVRVESAQERATLLRTSVLPQSLQVLDVARVAYQSDRADFLDLIDNQRVLLGAQLDYWRALADLAQARADLERAMGADLDTTTRNISSNGGPR
jgi:cobalt-zinc-cadmium efflux system outer membrane protein